MIQENRQVLALVKALLDDESASARFSDEDIESREAVRMTVKKRAHSASVGDIAAAWDTHGALDLIYEREFSRPRPRQSPAPLLLEDIRTVLESAMLERELTEIPAEWKQSPEEPKTFIRWLKQSISTHPACHHTFYDEFLRDHADREQLRYFLAQESTLDPRFDDIIALMQVGMRGNIKMEMANNYWDEMGNGEHTKVHSALFQKALDELHVDDEYLVQNTSLEALVTGNISACLSLRRRHVYLAIGYFGVTEYVPPKRLRFLVKAMERNGLSQEAIEYHRLHAVIDVRHALGWFNNVVIPLVAEDAEIRHEVAAGAYIRLNASLRYLDHMQQRVTVAAPK